MSIGNFPESLSQAMLVGIMLVGGLVILCLTHGVLLYVILVIHHIASNSNRNSNVNVTSKSPVGDISVVTLMKTYIILDHSQKAEKVC